MTDQSRENEAESGVPPPETPLWVKVSGLVALAVVSVFLVLLLIGGGHGPGRHTLGDHQEIAVHALRR
jgi:hypothetical protein